jgi:hypothetical protein
MQIRRFALHRISSFDLQAATHACHNREPTLTSSIFYADLNAMHPSLDLFYDFDFSFGKIRRFCFPLAPFVGAFRWRFPPALFLGVDAHLNPAKLDRCIILRASATCRQKG